MGIGRYHSYASIWNGRIAGQQLRSGNLVRRPTTPRPQPTPITASGSPAGRAPVFSTGHLQDEDLLRSRPFWSSLAARRRLR